MILYSMIARNVLTYGLFFNVKTQKSLYRKDGRTKKSKLAKHSNIAHILNALGTKQTHETVSYPCYI